MKKNIKKFDRYVAFIFIMFLIFFGIISRLIFLQIVKADEFKEQANNKSIKNIPEAAPRGPIYDRNKDVLATNIQSFTLIYNETVDSKKRFFETMDAVFDLLKEEEEPIQDDLALKINPYRFEFATESQSALRYRELRFKKDRGLEEKVRDELFPGKSSEELTEEDKDKINEELLNITPKEVYEYLLEWYKITPEEAFKQIISRYKSEPEEVLKIMKEKYKISSESNLIDLLDSYVDEPNNYYDLLKEECRIDEVKFTPEQERNYLIIKDTLKMQSYRGYKPVTISNNLSKETAFVFLQKLTELSGIDVSTQPIRYYPYNELGSSFLGYLSQINPDKKEKYELKGYDVSTDLIGVSGIEGVFEDVLRGTKGERLVKLNRQGRVIEELGSIEPYPGQGLVLTIDNNIQYAAEQALKQTMEGLVEKPRYEDGDNTKNATRGAAVVVDVHTGEVLAMASYPDFDPNLFAVPGRLTPDLYKKFFNPDLKKFGENYIKEKSLDISLDTLFPLETEIENNTTIRRDNYDIYPKPMFNYATRALLPPGSTFKPLTAIAGLETEVISPEETIYDGLVYTKNNYNGRDWNSRSYGHITVSEALESSINYFFFEVADRLANMSKDLLAEYAWKFGLGKPTGIEIPERVGDVYNVDYAKNLFGNIYYNEIIRALKSGKERFWKTSFNPINLDTEDKENPAPDIKEVDEISTLINNQVHFNENMISTRREFINQLSQLLENYINTSSEYDKEIYTKQSLNSISEIVARIIYDKAAYEINIYDNTRANLYNASIGQGINQFSPIELANYIATLVNGGKRYKLHLVNEYLDADGNLIEKVKPEIIEEIDIKDSTIDAVKKGMLKVTSGESGTAVSAFSGFPIVTAGKTGSATYNKNMQGKIGRTSYGVYVGFAPYENPEIAVSVVIFDALHGGYVAPVARAVYEEYFKDELKEKYPNYVPRYNFDLKEDKEN